MRRRWPVHRNPRTSAADQWRELQDLPPAPPPLPLAAWRAALQRRLPLYDAGAWDCAWAIGRREYVIDHHAGPRTANNNRGYFPFFQWNTFSESCLSSQSVIQERFHIPCGSTRRTLSVQNSIQVRDPMTVAYGGMSTVNTGLGLVARTRQKMKNRFQVRAAHWLHTKCNLGTFRQKLDKF